MNADEKIVEIMRRNIGKKSTMPLWGKEKSVITYDYTRQRPKLFELDGLLILLSVRDRAKELLKSAGAVRALEAVSGIDGDIWTALAALDFMVEQGELKCISHEYSGQQWRVFTDPKSP